MAVQEKKRTAPRRATPPQPDPSPDHTAAGSDYGDVVPRRAVAEADTQRDRITRQAEQQGAPLTQRPDGARSREDRIRDKAHELYVARGSQPGTADDDWLLAERQIGD